MPTYEQLLDRDRGWALSEGSRHFEGKSAVQEALRKIAHRLDDLGVPYAIAGGMALFLHGYRRFTEDVDILVTRDGLREIHEHLEGRAYVPPFSGSTNLGGDDTGVRIKFIVTGAYPADGRPKPVAFPDPAGVGESIEGITSIRLPRVIELKLASGGSPNRLRDLADVQELIRILRLPAEFADQLDPSVRAAYGEL